jgi:hypothetical protein
VALATGEALNILRPLAYAIALKKYGRKSWQGGC